MTKNKKTILVTGASGMLGLKLYHVLREKGFNVIKNKFDISSAKAVEEFSEKLKRLDCIIHCAAATDVNKCELEKKLCFSVNVTGTKNIVDMAQHFGANLIYISTPMVFSGTEGDYKETSRPKPLNYYAKTKLLGEKEVLKYKNSLVLRANPIGVRPPGAHPSFIQWFVDAARNNKSFTLFTDIRVNPISTTTFSDIISKLINDFKRGVLHLGSADVVNKAEIWDLILSRFSKFSGVVKKASVDKTETNKIAKRPKEMWLNVQKAVTLGYEMPSWKAEVARVLNEIIK